MDFSPLLLDIPEQLFTERMILRTYRYGDGPALNEAVLETWEALHTWIPWARVRPTVAESEAFARQSRANFMARADLTFLLELPDTPGLVGGAGLYHIDWDTPRFEVGYWIRRRCEGQGYATEAVRALCRLAFGPLKAERVELHCGQTNQRSVRVAERCGFKLEASLRNHQRQYGSRELRETLIFGLIRKDAAAKP
jgi:RimJ/RimL family protein N-acetyltransferase